MVLLRILIYTLPVHNFKDIEPSVGYFGDGVLRPRWIKLNGSEEPLASKWHFYGRCKIPAVVMCVDGTRIAVKVPVNNPHLYYNRKGFF